MGSVAATRLRPPRQVLSREMGGDLLSRTIAAHPVGSLTLIGTAIGGAWGGLAGTVVGLGRIGAGIGGVLLGARGYNIGKDLESWLKVSG